MNMHQDHRSTCASAALEYARFGWHVFPAPPGTKKSHKSAKHSDGREWGATTDTEEIARDWQRWPDANVGVVTGPKSGLLVIEADTEEGHGIDGIGNMAALLEQHGPLPETIEALSPTGSWHLYFRWPQGWEIGNSSSRIAAGIDVRGDGGMVVGVPSIKPGYPDTYRWKNPPPLFELADCPEWLLKLCIKPEAKLPERASPGPRIDTGGGTAWADNALRNEIAAVLAAPQGQRNATLNTAAFNLGQIIAGGALSQCIVTDRLSVAAAGIGLDSGEIAATIKSGLEAGAQTPREPREAKAPTSDGAPRPNAETDPDLSQDALASDLGAQSWDRNAKHVALWGKWLFWTGARWEVDDRLDHLTRTRAFLRSRADDLTAWAERKAGTIEASEGPDKAERMRRWAKEQSRTLRSKNTVAAVESLARANAPSVARPDDFDTERLLIGTPHGTVDLRTGAMRPAERGDMITKLTACAPAPGAPQRWLAFLNEVFDHDPEIVAFMQRAAGYALTGSTAEHKLLFLYGTGRNGKSVFLNTLHHLWADYATRAAAETFLNTQGDKHATGIAGLQGARLVIGSELPKGKSWDEATIKDLTGGDVMAGRYMRQDWFTFEPQLTLMIAGNNMPSFKGVDEAIRARVVLVPFTVTIPPEKRDKDLPDKLKAEGPQILQWAIDGARQWLCGGLQVPDKVAAASEQYFDDEDTLGQFLADETEADPMAFTTSTDLHQRFTQWCEQQGLHSWTLHTLRKELKTRGFQDHRRPHGRGFIGLQLR